MEYQGRVAVFGISANPPTGDGGHRGIVRYLVMSKYFQAVMVLPVYQHIYSTKSNLESYEHRMEMCRLNFEDLSATNCPVAISHAEKSAHLHQENPNRRLGTIDILAYLRKIYPRAQFHFVLGTDAYSDLLAGKWKSSETLLKTTPLEVISRMSVPPVPIDGQMSSIFTRFHKIPGLTGVSSTLIRSKAPSFLDGCVSLRFLNINDLTIHLHPKVYQYLMKHRLYGFSIIARCKNILFNCIIAYLIVYTLWRLLKYCLGITMYFLKS